MCRKLDSTPSTKSEQKDPRDMTDDELLAGYCVKEKAIRVIQHPTVVTMKNGKLAIKGHCPEPACGTGMYIIDWQRALEFRRRQLDGPRPKIIGTGKEWCQKCLSRQEVSYTAEVTIGKNRPAILGFCNHCKTTFRKFGKL